MIRLPFRPALKNALKFTRHMGYLETHGRPISFPEAAQYADYIRDHAIAQFINLYNIHKGKQQDLSKGYKWGDETEYHVVRLDKDNKLARLDFNGYEYRQAFNAFYKERFDKYVILQPEYGAWMFEAIPASPFPSLSSSTFAGLDQFFRLRRDTTKEFLKNYGDVSIISIPSYPLLGVGQYATFGPNISTFSLYDNEFSQSVFTFDKGINPHPRFPNLTKSIRERRGNKVSIEVPLFIDTNTKVQTKHPATIHMDSMAFGMGCCCLQLTFDSANIDHARYLHDQLHVFAPIFAALSASSPIFRGLLADQDLRFNVIEQCVDDRRDYELDPLSPNYIPKSRYSTLNHYISSHPFVESQHNDAPKFHIKEHHMEALINAGIDTALAYHIAAICSRDPLVIFSKAIYLDDTKRIGHFENLQTTNWNTVRFKPPPGVGSKIGWRVEFRPLDVQLTDYENAAMVTLIGLVVKLINQEKNNFIIPISKCDENMRRAHKRNAIVKEKFYFRTNVGKIVEMTLSEILEGKSSVNHKGLLPMLKELLDKEPVGGAEKDKVLNYLEFLRDRAKGKYKTGAKLIREFVQGHSEYKKDSVVTQGINYDLMCFLDKVNSGPLEVKDLYKNY